MFYEELSLNAIEISPWSMNLCKFSLCINPLVQLTTIFLIFCSAEESEDDLAADKSGFDDLTDECSWMFWLKTKSGSTDNHAKYIRLTFLY